MPAMSPGRRMKYEMTMANRKRRGASGIELQLDAMGASDGDRAEVARFAAFLGDSASMKLPELVEKHGAEYLGFTAAEAAAISHTPATREPDSEDTR